MNKFITPLQFLSFTTGFVLMVFEMVAARILAPSIGSSTYVWTGVIGVIIAALSGGYWLGGKLADARNDNRDVAWLCLATAFVIGIVLLLYPGTLDSITTRLADSRLQAVAASLILFAPASALLGMISPYLVKLNVQSLETSGQSVASLSALNSIGGITGTFTAGFLLFSYIGSRESLVLIVSLMVLASWLMRPKNKWRLRIAVSTAIVMVSLLPALGSDGAASIDTSSARYTIYEGKEEGTGRAIRGIATGPGGIQSGIYIHQPNELLFWYTKQMAAVVERATSRGSILVLGGGTFTLPQYLASTYPDSRVDVVEIDPELVSIAQNWFAYTAPSNIRLIFDDARAFLNRTDDQYDIVLVDVYGDTEVPFSFMTKEYGQHIRAVTKPGGVVAVNMVAGNKGACSELLGALAAPYAGHFAYNHHYINYPELARSNLIAVYSDTPLKGSDGLHPKADLVYTDNYAPAERLQQACRDEQVRS